jgi:hypothetical protein
MINIKNPNKPTQKINNNSKPLLYNSSKKISKLKKYGGNRKANGKKRYNKGKYKIINESKYMGDISNCIWRSTWELYFMRWCDLNTLIKRWSSESMIIPYQDETGKYHRYYPDFYIERIDKNDLERLDRIVIEIKPKKETKEPIQPKKITAKSLETYEYQLKTYQKNLYKWTRTKNWCDKNKMKFIIVHEEHLKKYNIM